MPTTVVADVRQTLDPAEDPQLQQRVDNFIREQERRLAQESRRDAILKLLLVLAGILAMCVGNYGDARLSTKRDDEPRPFIIGKSRIGGPDRLR